MRNYKPIVKLARYKDPNYKHNWYLKNKEKIKQRRLKRYYKNRKEELDYNKNYKKENIEQIRKLRIKNSSDYRKKYPEKIKARSIANKLDISVMQICEMCKISLAEEKHHPDYSRPLEVKFLCIKCHNDLHGGI